MFDLYKHIENLGKARGYKNMTVLCKAAQVPRSNMSELNAGRSHTIKLPTAQKFAALLGVSLDEIYGDAEREEPAEAEIISPEAHHIGVLFDRADEKDRLLTHTVLDKYDDMENVTAINTKSRNPGGFVEFDVYDEPAAAGLGNYLDAPQSHREQFPSIIVPKGADFGIRISGNSMEPMVADGSTVFVRQTMTVDSGRVGIFVLNGASYCKQLIVDHAKKEVRLRSFNPDYADIIVTPADTLVTIGQVL